MPVLIIPLDTQKPGVWDGTPLAVTPVVNPATALRPTLGNDKQNYFTQQRVQGDLFNRDLVANQNALALYNYIATRTGIAYNLPASLIQPGKYIQIGQIKLPISQTPKLFSILLSVALVESGPSAADISLQIFDITANPSVPVLTRTAADTSSIFQASALTDRGQTFPSSDLVEVRLYNLGAVEASCTACFVWQPSTIA